MPLIGRWRDARADTELYETSLDFLNSNYTVDKHTLIKSTHFCVFDAGIAVTIAAVGGYFAGPYADFTVSIFLNGIPITGTYTAIAAAGVTLAEMALASQNIDTDPYGRWLAQFFAAIGGYLEGMVQE